MGELEHYNTAITSLLEIFTISLVSPAVSQSVPSRCRAAALPRPVGAFSTNTGPWHSRRGNIKISKRTCPDSSTLSILRSTRKTTQQAVSRFVKKLDPGPAGWVKLRQKNLCRDLLEVVLVRLNPRPTAPPSQKGDVFCANVKPGCAGTAEDTRSGASDSSAYRQPQPAQDSVPLATEAVQRGRVDAIAWPKRPQHREEESDSSSIVDAAVLSSRKPAGFRTPQMHKKARGMAQVVLRENKVAASKKH